MLICYLTVLSALLLLTWMHWDVSNKMLFILAADRCPCPLHFLHSTFHKVWYISYLVPISHLPQLLKYFHCILTLFSEISFPFWLCPPRTLPAQKPFYFFFSSVLSLLDLEMGGCPPPSYSLSGQVPSLLLVLKLTSSSYRLNYCDLPAAALFSVHWIIGLLSLSD